MISPQASDWFCWIWKDDAGGPLILIGFYKCGISKIWYGKQTSFENRKTSISLRLFGQMHNDTHTHTHKQSLQLIVVWNLNKYMIKCRNRSTEWIRRWTSCYELLKADWNRSVLRCFSKVFKVWDKRMVEGREFLTIRAAKYTKCEPKWRSVHGTCKLA